MGMLALAVLLAVMQASPPLPRQTADSATSAGSTIQKQAQPKKTIPAQAPPANAKQAPEHDAAGHEDGTNNAEHSVSITKLPPVTVASPKRDWADWGVLGFTFLLAVTSVLQIWLLRRTLRYVRRQAHEMTKQRHEMWEQRKVMAGQLEAMRGQIAQMESAGKQTAELVRHAEGQVTALTDSAQTAKEMAEAARISAMVAENGLHVAELNARVAKASTDAFIHAQRPWISIKTALAGPLTFDEQAARIEIKVLLENVGQMPAMGVFIHPFFYIEGVPDRPSAADERKRMCKDSHSTTQIGQVIFPGQPVASRIGISARVSDIEASWTAFWADKVVAEKVRWFGAKIIVVVGYGTGIDKDAAYYTGAMYDLHKKEPGRGDDTFSLKIETTPLESLQLHLDAIAAIIAE